jgi:hypothetical protein
MTTREQIEAQLRAENPTTTDDSGERHGPGSPVYEAAISRWADAMEAKLYVSPADQIAQIKAEASGRILAVIPDWRQRNMIARSVELLEIREAGEILTAAELRELDAIRAAWAWARSVRAYSDQLEALVAQGEAVDPATAEWPVFRP